MSSDSNNNLIPGNLPDQVNSAASASSVIQVYAQTLLTQPLITGVTELPNLSAHQQTAQGHAQNWLNTLLPQYWQVLDDVNGFCNNFQSYYTPLYNLAQLIVNGDTSQVPTFNQGLSELATIVTTNETTATTLYQALELFSTQVSTDAANFESDYQTASVSIIGDNGELSQLNSELQAANSAIGNDTAMIAGGAVAAVVGGLMICVGALAEFETAGLSTGLIVAGAVVVSGGIATAIYGGVELSKDNDLYGSLTSQIATLNADMNALTTVQGQIQGLQAACAAAATAVQAVAQAWNVVGANFNTLEQQLVNNVSAASPFLLPQLQAAQSDWQDLQTHVQELETFNFNSLPTSSQTVGQLLGTQALAA